MCSSQEGCEEGRQKQAVKGPRGPGSEAKTPHPCLGSSSWSPLQCSAPPPPRKSRPSQAPSHRGHREGRRLRSPSRPPPLTDETPHLLLAHVDTQAGPGGGKGRPRGTPARPLGARRRRKQQQSGEQREDRAAAATAVAGLPPSRGIAAATPPAAPHHRSAPAPPLGRGRGPPSRALRLSSRSCSGRARPRYLGRDSGAAPRAPARAPLPRPSSQEASQAESRRLETIPASPVSSTRAHQSPLPCACANETKDSFALLCRT